jgi:hypothetical protein
LYLAHCGDLWLRVSDRADAATLFGAGKQTDPRGWRAERNGEVTRADLRPPVLLIIIAERAGLTTDGTINHARSSRRVPLICARTRSDENTRTNDICTESRKALRPILLETILTCLFPLYNEAVGDCGVINTVEEK